MVDVNRRAGGAENLLANISPFNIAVEVLGKPLTVPILPYLNLAARLSIILAAATILAGSFLANESWSKPMMSVRGMMLPIIFICGLFIGLRMAGSYLDLSIPLTGEFTLKYTIQYGEFNIATETPATATITNKYWIAIAAGVISILAKALQGRMAGREHAHHNH